MAQFSSFSSRRRRIEANAYSISPCTLQKYFRIDDSSSTAPSTPTNFTVLLCSSISRSEKPCTDFASDFLYQTSRVIQNKGEQRFFRTKFVRPITVKSSRHHGSPFTFMSSLKKTPSVITCSRDILSEQSPRHAAQHLSITRSSVKRLHRGSLCSNRLPLLRARRIISCGERP